VRLTRRLGAPPGEVWATLTSPDSLSRWLARPLRLELAPGGRIELAVGSDGAGRVVGGVRRVEPGRLLELDWRGPGEDPSVVRFELSPDGDGTLLVLDHRLIEEPVGMAYISRWTRSLARLEASLGADRR
jgi:uncharacterized protein YndB with AHSA1/START domain